MLARDAERFTIINIQVIFCVAVHICLFPRVVFCQIVRQLQPFFTYDPTVTLVMGYKTIECAHMSIMNWTMSREQIWKLVSI